MTYLDFSISNSFYDKIQSKVSVMNSSTQSTDRLEEEFIIACEVEMFPTGSRVSQLPKTFIAEGCLVMQKH